MLLPRLHLVFAHIAICKHESLPANTKSSLCLMRGGGFFFLLFFLGFISNLLSE